MNTGRPPLVFPRRGPLASPSEMLLPSGLPRAFRATIQPAGAMVKNNGHSTVPWGTASMVAGQGRNEP